MKEKLNIMDLQLFAEDGEDTQTEDTQTEESKDEGFDISKLLEHPEFKKHMESYADKRVSGALQKKQKEYEAKLDQEKKKASMTAEELQAEKERELAEREQQLKAYELKLAKLDYFKEKDYDIALLDYVDGKDEDEIKVNADNLISALDKLVQKQVESRLKHNSHIPPKGTTQDINISEMDMEQFAKYWQDRNK